jgi:hypothetical protein
MWVSYYLEPLEPGMLWHGDNKLYQGMFQSGPPLNHYIVLHTWITSQVELSEPKVGPADKQPSYLRKKPTSVVRLFEYIRNCYVFEFLNYFRIREKSIKFEMANQTKRHKKKTT